MYLPSTIQETSGTLHGEHITIWPCTANVRANTTAERPSMKKYEQSGILTYKFSLSIGDKDIHLRRLGADDFGTLTILTQVHHTTIGLVYVHNVSLAKDLYEKTNNSDKMAS